MNIQGSGRKRDDDSDDDGKKHNKHRDRY
jgi:hypothetical protein